MESISECIDYSNLLKSELQDSKKHINSLSAELAAKDKELLAKNAELAEERLASSLGSTVRGNIITNLHTDLKILRKHQKYLHKRLLILRFLKYQEHKIMSVSQ